LFVKLKEQPFQISAQVATHCASEGSPMVRGPSITTMARSIWWCIDNSSLCWRDTDLISRGGACCLASLVSLVLPNLVIKSQRQIAPRPLASSQGLRPAPFSTCSSDNPSGGTRIRPYIVDPIKSSYYVGEFSAPMMSKRCINTLLFAWVSLHFLKHLRSGTLSLSTSIRH
jgi:hypothetical protein